MKITKFGHCCLLIEEQGIRFLTDPGIFSTLQDEVVGVDVVVISHEHKDHFHINSLKNIIKNNPQAVIVTNSAVDKLLREEQISDAIIVEDGQCEDVAGLSIRGFGYKHAEIYREYGNVLNTGYMIGDRLYYPGDSFHNPLVKVDVLALPVSGPWCKIKDSIEFALDINPKKLFPVHDGVLNDFGLNTVNNGVLKSILIDKGVELIQLEIGKESSI